MKSDKKANTASAKSSAGKPTAASSTKSIASKAAVAQAALAKTSAVKAAPAKATSAKPAPAPAKLATAKPASAKPASAKPTVAKAGPPNAAASGKPSKSAPSVSGRQATKRPRAGTDAASAVQPRRATRVKAASSPVVEQKAAATAEGAELVGHLPPVPHVPSAPTVSVYQIYFEAGQRLQLEPEFIPFNNVGQAGTLLEFSVFERLAADDGVRIAPLWGAVSWRFREKTGLGGQAYLDAIAANPGFDLYYCNPSPENEALYANLWQQGITTHPSFRELAEAVFKAGGLDPKELDDIMPSTAFSSCNYFVGSPRFWSTYLPFVRRVVDQARANLPTATLEILDSSQADPRSLHAGATYWPFIVERILPVFLRHAGDGIKTHKITLPALDGRLNSHLKRLREMKDVAHRTRSLWLYSCWLHYRNLFLLQTAGREWCTRYLPLISPAEVKFW